LANEDKEGDELSLLGFRVASHVLDQPHHDIFNPIIYQNCRVKADLFQRVSSVGRLEVKVANWFIVILTFVVCEGKVNVLRYCDLKNGSSS
jgi:hypothetical protein